MSESCVSVESIRDVMNETVRGRDISLELGLSEFIRGGASGLDTALQFLERLIGEDGFSVGPVVETSHWRQPS